MQIITGRPHRLLKECVRRIGRAVASGEACMMLVPSQYTLQAEIDVMTGLNQKGSFLIDVLSPGRLQGRVFERAGQPEHVLFDERGKRMVLSDVIEQEKESLSTYQSAARHGNGGLAGKMSPLIASFKRSGMTAQEVALAAERMDPRSGLSKKIRDAAKIYAAYEERMQGELADAEDAAREMCARMRRSGVLEGQRVFVYGFDMITPAFAAELIHMAGLAKSVTLAVETDENSAADGRLFAPVNFSLERLRALARERGIPVAEERITGELEAPEEIRFLEQNLFALGGKPFEKAPGCVELRTASSMRREVHLAAARMRTLAMAGEDSTEMAVVYPKGSGYAPLLASILPAYGLTPYIAEKRPASAHPLCRFVLSALAVVAGGWRTSDIVDCAQSGMMGLAQEEIDSLCTYCETLDIRPGAFTRPFSYIREGTEEALEKLNQIREKVAGPLQAFERALASAERPDDMLAAIVNLLGDVHALETLEAMRVELEENGLASEAQDCAQVWAALMETLDQMHTLLGERHVPVRLAMTLLESGLSALELSALPPADGAVICGEIGNVRMGPIKTLWALGMNDMQAAADGGLLSPDEQEEAERITGAYLGMRPSERAALAHLDELKALSGASRRVIVSYALADETGKALREGTAVQALRRIFPEMPVQGGMAEEEEIAMLCAREPALEALSVYLSDAADGRREWAPEYGAAYAALAGDEEGMASLRMITENLGSEPERRLESAQARRLYGRPVISVSRLETFAQCPYRHFIRYGLAPQEEKEAGVDRAELGTLYHEAADRFTRAVTALPEFPQVEPDVCDRLMDEAIAPLIEKWRASPLGSSARGDAVARRIGKTARRTARNMVSHYAGSRFRPLCTELVFGQNGIAPIMLELPDGTFVYLQGRIDRVDVLDAEEKVIRIVDYKSGGQRFDPTMVYGGLQLQLLLYLAAALAQIPGSHAGGFFYCRIADPMIRSESRIREEIERQIAQKLSLAGISLSDVQILRAQDEYHAAMVTREGKPNGRYAAAMVDEEGMQSMIGFAEKKAAELAAGAYAGIIAHVPAQREAFTACQTCRYAAICGFDPTRHVKKRLSKKTLEDLRE